MRVIWLIAGSISLGLGLLGVFLPLLPTVPFVLLAAFCFARSSERLHDWMLEHPKFGPAIAGPLLEPLHRHRIVAVDSRANGRAAPIPVRLV